MRTTAQIKGHALHQMLIPFPIAFLTGAFISDLLGLFLHDLNLNRTAFYLSVAGVITGVTAAAPGFIDYLFTIPPESSAKKRGTKHMLANLTAVALFTISLIIRDKITFDPGFAVLAAETAGTILIGIGGWMGGTLVNRNFIGPDHRYAHAGKWKETRIREKKDVIEVASVDELKVNQMKLIKIGKKRIAVGKTENGWFAVDDFCTHRGGSLAGGVLICGTVQCLWHGSQFDTSKGSVKAGPAVKPVSTYKVMIIDGKVLVVVGK